MVKIFNRGLSKKGVKEITKHFDMEFEVGEIIGIKSKIMEEFDQLEEKYNSLKA